MISSSLSSEQSQSSTFGAVGHKLLKIQQEVLLLDKHNMEHITKGETKHPTDNSCFYCQKNSPKPTNHQERKKVEASFEIERVVEISGKSGCVIVPKAWMGKMVRIALLNDNEC